MTREWYIKISEKKEGPYSVKQLLRDERLTPYTLVWKKGFEFWQELRYVPDLFEVLEEIEKRDQKKDPYSQSTDDEIALDFAKPPSMKMIFIIIILTLICIMLWIQQLGFGK